MAPNDRESAGGRVFDLATVLGIPSALGLVVAAIVTGSGVGVFLDFPAMLIVLGGTFGIILASYSFKDLWLCAKQVPQTVSRASTGYYNICYQLIQISQLARTKGILAIAQYADSYKNSRLMYMGIIMLSDGMPHNEIETLMSREASNLQQQSNQIIMVLRKLAEVAPAMGLIGTLVGLVQMLGKLENPEAIGPAMAVALLTTFYGAVLANLVFTPLANKLEKISDEALILNQIFVVSVTSIARHENPRKLEILMNSVLPSHEQVKFFE